MVDVSSENGTTTREMGVNNAECAAIALALSRVVGVVMVMGKVIDTIREGNTWCDCWGLKKNWKICWRDGFGKDSRAGCAVKYIRRLHCTW